MKIEKRRVRIECPDGQACTSHVTLMDTGELLPVTEVHFHLKASDVARAEVTCVLARLDAVVDADITWLDALDRANKQIVELKARLAQYESAQKLPD